MNDTMQEVGLGVETEDDRKIASDFMEWQASESRDVDRRVNWFFTLLVVVIGVVAVFA